MGRTDKMRTPLLTLAVLLGAITAGCGQSDSDGASSTLAEQPSTSAEDGDTTDDAPVASSLTPNQHSSNDAAIAAERSDPAVMPSSGDGVDGATESSPSAPTRGEPVDPSTPASTAGPAGEGGAPPADTETPGPFEAGSRFVIPQQEQTSLTFRTPEYEAGQGVASAAPIIILDDPGLAMEYPVTFDTGIFRPPPDCSDPYQEGHFEVRSIQVEEDLDGEGTHLRIDQEAEGYVLRHDGPGRHEVVVSGVFVIEQPELSDPQDPESYFPAECVLVPWGSEQPVSFRTSVLVKQAASAVAKTNVRCGDEPHAISGRGLRVQITLLDESGDAFFAANISNSQAIDLILETEGEATLDEAAFGFGAGGIVLSGAPQKVRLSTRFGPLLTYNLIELGTIDEWQVDFRYSRMNVKIPLEPLVNGATYPILTPAALESRAYVAEAILKVGDTPVCSPILRSDFVIATSSDVCSVAELQDGFDEAVPGIIATSWPVAGTCSVQLGFPAARRGAGLSLDFTATWVDDALGWDMGSHRDASKRGCTPDRAIELQDMFDSMWLAHFECDVVDADLRIDGAIDSTLFESIQEVTGSLDITSVDPADDLSGFSNLRRVGGTLSLGHLPTLGPWEFPSLTAIGRLQVHGSAASPLQSPALLSFPLLASVGDVSISSVAGLQTLAMPRLASAQQLVLTNNDDLTLLDLPALTSALSLEVKSNPALAQCAVDQLSTQVGRACTNCENNDDLATCP